MALKATLDTRFFLAYFSPKTQAEWCKSVIREAGKAGSLLMASTTTILSSMRIWARIIGKENVCIRIASIKAGGVNFMSVDEGIASEAGEIVLKDRAIPVADAIIAATAKRHAPTILNG